MFTTISHEIDLLKPGLRIFADRAAGSLHIAFVGESIPGNSNTAQKFGRPSLEHGRSSRLLFLVVHICSARQGQRLGSAGPRVGVQQSSRSAPRQCGQSGRPVRPRWGMAFSEGLGIPAPTIGSAKLLGEILGLSPDTLFGSQPEAPCGTSSPRVPSRGAR